MSPGQTEIGASGRSLAGSLQLKSFEVRRRKPLQNKPLRRRVSGGFFGDNSVVDWVRYGLDSVSGPRRFRIHKSQASCSMSHYPESQPDSGCR
jgi:hypothetical protein